MASCDLQIDISLQIELSSIKTFITNKFSLVELLVGDYSLDDRFLVQQQLMDIFHNINMVEWVNINTDEGTQDLMNELLKNNTILNSDQVYQIIINASVVYILNQYRSIHTQ